MTLPSRRTGTPNKGSKALASFEARICSGKVIWLKMIAGIGIARSRTSNGKRSSFRSCHPPKLSTSPANRITSEIRDKKQFRAVDTQKQNRQPQGNNCDSAPGGSEFRVAKGLSLRPHQVRRKDRDQKAVGKIGYLPPVGHQFRQHTVVHRQHECADKRRTPCKMSALKRPGALRNRRRQCALGHILRKGTCGNPIRYSFLSNRNAESGIAQSKWIPHELARAHGTSSSQA